MNVGGSDTSMNMPSLVSFDIWKHIDVLNIQKLNQQGQDQQTESKLKQMNPTVFQMNKRTILKEEGEKIQGIYKDSI